MNRAKQQMDKTEDKYYISIRLALDGFLYGVWREAPHYDPSNLLFLTTNKVELRMKLNLMDIGIGKYYGGFRDDDGFLVAAYFSLDKPK